MKPLRIFLLAFTIVACAISAAAQDKSDKKTDKRYDRTLQCDDSREAFFFLFEKPCGSEQPLSAFYEWSSAVLVESANRQGNFILKFRGFQCIKLPHCFACSRIDRCDHSVISVNPVGKSIAMVGRIVGRSRHSKAQTFGNHNSVQQFETPLDQ